ncbi:MAG: hypothetical protein ACR2N6_08200 [Miltoncostaeaceae bacterium]
MRDALLAEPSLSGSLRAPGPEPLLAPLAHGALSPVEAEGLDLILEGFLLHHGRPRYLDIDDAGHRVLAGDYCYATGLVRVAAAGDLFVIDALSALIAASAELVARDRRDLLEPAWRATAAAIIEPGNGSRARGGEFLNAAGALAGGEGDALIETLAATLDPTPGLSEALTP